MSSRAQQQRTSEDEARAMQRESQSIDPSSRKKLHKRAPHSQSYASDLPLRRSPSAPQRNRSNSNTQQPALHHRSPTLPSPGTSSHTSIDSTLANASHLAYQQNYNTSAGQYHHQPRFSVSEKTSTDLLGQRFDSAAILSNLNAVPYSSDPQPSQLQPPPRLQQQSDFTALRPSRTNESSSTGSTVALADPSVRLSESFAATGRRMEDIASPRGDLRYGDEAKEGKALKKKSGFSKFVNDLVGSPRRPAISAPENPVHVTHVGYDQETGEFTVCTVAMVLGSSGAHASATGASETMPSRGFRER